MAWNEPGGSGKDPWGNRNKDQGPPDLDEVVRKMQQKIGGIFGKRGGGGGGGGGNLPFSGSVIWAAVGVILVVWLLSGFYIIDAAERGLILRFGQFQESTKPGLHWRFPTPIDSVYRVNVEEIRNVEIGFSGASTNLHESLMLTKDENIVDIKLAAQYRVSDAKNYRFNVKDPDITLKEAVESALREVVGKTKMDFVLTEGRAEIQDRVQTLAQEIMDRYETGLILTSINVQNAQAPAQVQEAFADVVKAREDKQRLINEAQTYKNEVLPRARGNAARQLEEAQGYKERVIARATGEAQRFTSVLTEYEQAPKVTKERLYIETIQDVLKKTNKVFLDVNNSNNMLFLPLDRILGESTRLRFDNDLFKDQQNRNRESSTSDMTSRARSFSRRDETRSRRERQ